MTNSITSAVDSLKLQVRESFHPDLIHDACQSVGHRWRVRILDPVTTIWLFALQVLHGNTACAHCARLMPGVQVSDSAYCQARRRLPLSVFRRLFHRLRHRLLEATDQTLARWHGHRVFFIDGSTCSMPDTPELQTRFGQPSGQLAGCGFPSLKLVALFRAGSGLLVDTLIGPLYCHEAKIAYRLFTHLHPGDVLIGDRAFCSYVIIALLARRSVHVLMRQHQRRVTDFRRGRRLGESDQIIEWTRPKKCPTWMAAATFAGLPRRFTVRRVAYRIEANGYRTQKVVLITTLLDASIYPVGELAARYNERWQVETSFRHLKQTMRMETLKCKTADGVEKEVWMFAIIYNLVRVTMVRAGLRQGVDPERISFIDVLRWLTLRGVGEPMPRFVVNPDRPGRHQPRVVKRRPKQYSLLTHPREEMRKAMKGWTL